MMMSLGTILRTIFESGNKCGSQCTSGSTDLIGAWINHLCKKELIGHHRLQ